MNLSVVKLTKSSLTLRVASSSEDFTQEEWASWDAHLQSNPSAYLDSRSIKAALNIVQRQLQAVMWVDEDGVTVGIASIEDSRALSSSRGRFLKGDKPIFKLAQRYLYRGDGIFKFPVRVMGTVLSSGDHAFRFTPDFPQALLFDAIHTALSLLSSDGTPPPKSTLVKDHYATVPWPTKIAGSSLWHKSWIDLEFDPVMEVDLKAEWKTFEDYSAALRKKSRTKIRRILRGSEELELKNLSLEEVEKSANELYDLYCQVYDRAGFKLGMLYPEDLIELKRNWGEDFPVIAYYLDGELVGFQCGILTPDVTEAFFVGFSVEENKLHFMYQRMLIEFIIQALGKGSKRIALGRTALDIKSSLGACPKRLVCHMKIDRPLVHSLTRAIALASSPKIPSLKRAWDDDRVSIFAGDN
jgi:hypothetical protein